VVNAPRRFFLLVLVGDYVSGDFNGLELNNGSTYTLSKIVDSVITRSE